MKPTYTELVDSLRQLLDQEERHRIAAQAFRSGEISADQMIREDNAVLETRVTARRLLARDARAYPRTCPVSGMGMPVSGMGMNLQLEAARAMGLVGGHELRAEGRMRA